MVPVYIIAITQVYIFFAFAVPVYIFAVFRKKKWYFKTVVSFVAMGIEAGGSYYLLHLISSNYTYGSKIAGLQAPPVPKMACPPSNPQ